MEKYLRFDPPPHSIFIDSLTNKDNKRVSKNDTNDD